MDLKKTLYRRAHRNYNLRPLARINYNSSVRPMAPSPAWKSTSLCATPSPQKRQRSANSAPIRRRASAIKKTKTVARHSTRRALAPIRFDDLPLVTRKKVRLSKKSPVKRDKRSQKGRANAGKAAVRALKAGAAKAGSKKRKRASASKKPSIPRRPVGRPRKHPAQITKKAIDKARIRKLKKSKGPAKKSPAKGSKASTSKH